jgi:hypothetical protein
MMTASQILASTKTGLEVNDIRDDEAFASRSLHTYDLETQMAGVQRLVQAIVATPNTVLQELVNVAVDLCGADSAGISIEREHATDAEFYHWVATAGAYSGFLNAILPRYPSACGVCLERGVPQQFRVDKLFFDILGVEAPLVTDGLLIPWEADGTRGTIFIMAHGRTEAFDASDCRLMEMLSGFAAMAFRQQRLQAKLLLQAQATAAGAMANELAHQINNPLQCLTNILYLAECGAHGEEARVVGKVAAENLQRLSTLVARLLALPLAETSQSSENRIHLAAASTARSA